MDLNTVGLGPQFLVGLRIMLGPSRRPRCNALKKIIIGNITSIIMDHRGCILKAAHTVAGIRSMEADITVAEV